MQNTYIAIVRTKDLSHEDIINVAENNVFYSNLKRRFISKKVNLSSPDDFKPIKINKFKNTQYEMALNVPVPQSFLVYLAQRGKFDSKYTEILLKNFPLLMVSVLNETLKPSLSRYLYEIRVFLLLFLLGGTALCIRLRLLGLNFRFQLNQKLFLAF